MKKYEYDNIMNLARKNNFKKIMVVRNSWSYGNWCIVNKVILNDYNNYGFAFGYVHYKSSDTRIGKIDCAGTYAWRVIKVLEDDLEVDYRKGNKVR